MNNVDAAHSYLVGTCQKLTGSGQLLCKPVLFDERFINGYGSSVGSGHAHHAYPGGLVVHTAEVMQTALATAESIGIIADPFTLTIAALWHDYAKIYDYDEEGKGTPYRDRVRHVAGSYHEFMKVAERLRAVCREGVGHCILAHHGRKEWGSPVEPQSVEAAILHYADMLSMQFGIGRTA